MSSSISLVTYAGQTVTPQDDALVYESALGDGGIIYGGEVTLKNANTLHINAGHGVIAGRKFTIFASDIAIPLSASGTLLGRLYIHMDLGNTSDPIDILYETGNSLTPPVQDADVNIINGVFEFNLATFTVSTSTIADLSNIYPQIQYANSGSFIYVDTISPELIGAQVEVTDGVDTITAIFDANGRAELKNVFMTGTLQITASSGIYSAGTTLSVPYFGTYNVSLALWMATLNISTSNSVLFGQQITITDSSSAVIGTTTFSNVGTATFIVGAPDTYTLSVTYGGNTYTSTVNVTAETTYNVSINTLPDGATVLPTDDVQTWLSCAAISGLSYTTIVEVIADSETYNALLGDSNASAYMARSTTWTTDICVDQYAMNLLGQYDTACDALLSDSTWASAIANSTYFESVLNVKVPVMTSATTPSGEASGIIYGSTVNNDAWKAFDGNTSTTSGTTYLSTYSPSGGYLQYQFASAVVINGCYVRSEYYTGHSDGYGIKGIVVLGSNDGSTFTQIATGTRIDNANQDYSFGFANDTAYEYYRVEFPDNVSAGIYVGVLELQFYGRTTSSEKVHGANGESAYILDGGSPVTITDPSTLDAGTYTVYSTVAKDPTDLTADYSKTIRICPNTKEIVVRPDNALYWWGYKSQYFTLEVNGWGIPMPAHPAYDVIAPTDNTNNVTIVGNQGAGWTSGGVYNLPYDSFNSVYFVIDYSVADSSAIQYIIKVGDANTYKSKSMSATGLHKETIDKTASGSGTLSGDVGVAVCTRYSTIIMYAVVSE